MSILKIKDSQGNWVGVPTVKGDTGNGISSAVLNDDYTLTLTFTNGTTYTTPSIRGEKGEQGEPATDMDIHICSASEYDVETRIPTIANPNDKTFYLVPTEDGTSPDLFTEWVYVNNAWEMFGSMKIDLTDYVKNTDIGTTTKGGVFKVAVDASIKAGSGSSVVVPTGNQHKSVFYGLAKASGDTTQSQSDNPVGTYTDEAKASIKSMLGVQDGMVVTATLVSGTQYTIDSTYDAIKTALSAGKTVVVMTGGVPQPYVGNVQLYGEWYLAFGVSTIYDNIATLTGFMIPQTHQNVAIWTQQNTTIPQLNDVQINGTSIVQDGVANVPMADESNLGAVTVNGAYGIGRFGTNGALYINAPSSAYIKSGTNNYRPIVPKFQHESVFYGLAKSAGDTTQSQSSNAVGTYTESAKSAISDMLNGAVQVSGIDPTIVAKNGIRYVCGEVLSLNFTPSANGICDVMFTSGSTPTVLTLPNTVKMPEWFIIEANTTYEINIADGIYGAVISWTA